MTTLSPEGVITDQVSGNKVLVFEGFMDFLSWMSNVQQETPEYDCCILNSVSNIEKALPWIIAHKNIASFMDNDEAGQNTLQKIIDNIPDDAGDVCIYDMAKLYKGYNDNYSDDIYGTYLLKTDGQGNLYYEFTVNYCSIVNVDAKTGEIIQARYWDGKYT
jgi:hypothetical protein